MERYTIIRTPGRRYFVRKATPVATGIYPVKWDTVSEHGNKRDAVAAIKRYREADAHRHAMKGK